MDLFVFADGLTEWMHGGEELSDEAEAAASIVAEILHMHRAWLKSKFKNKGDR